MWLKNYSNRTSSPLLLAVSLTLMLIRIPPALSGEVTGSGIVKGETPQGYPYMSGSVDADERDQMKSQANRYDLQLSFADHSGEYLSDVRVAIDDGRGKEIINTTTAGPWFYIQLPAGKYYVKATFANRQEEIENLQISEAHRATRLLHWDIADHQLSQR